MNWKQIDKGKRIQNKGVYTDWKEQISEDCFKQCVYCSIHEGRWGGIDHYHIDHFRPQSIFKTLKNDITNLYYSCPICNKFKSNDWQNEPSNLDVICYPDPSDFNYSELFNIEASNHLLVGKYISSTYLINRLYLNRPQLVYERREYFLQLKAEALINDSKKLIEVSEDIVLIKQAFRLIANLTHHLHIRDKVSPYKLVDIKKPKNKKA